MVLGVIEVFVFGMMHSIVLFVSNCTVTVTLILFGNHSETIHFNVITTPKDPLGLGHPWLKLDNPHIDLPGGRMIGWSPFCHSSCLKSALPPAEVIVSPPSSVPPDLSTIPTQYHGLGKVSSPPLPLTVPLISFQGPLYHSRGYNLSCPERGVIKRYTNDEKGVTRAGRQA